MIIDSSNLRKSLETQDTLSIYGEFHNIFESIVHEIKGLSSEKETANSSILLLSQIKGILHELEDKIKENDKNGILLSLELLEGHCQKL